MSRGRSSRLGARSPSTTWRSPGRRCARGRAHRLTVSRQGPRRERRGHSSSSAADLRGVPGMRRWGAQRVAEAAGARLVGAPEDARSGPGPLRATVDSRGAGPGDLFVGLRGERVDGGSYAAEALRSGAWGVLVTPERAEGLRPDGADRGTGGVVLAHPDPLRGLQGLALAWRR